MRFYLKNQVEQLNKKHRRKGIWRRIVTIMAVIVVFCTTYALILPAITVETNEKCGMSEHLHTESCYGADGALICETHQHTHDAQCYVAFSLDTATPDSASPSTFALSRAATNSDEIVPDGVNDHYYSDVYMYYEYSPYEVSYYDRTSSSNSSSTMTTFVLVPTEEQTYTWTANPTSGWSADIDSNYDVAYCADIDVYTSGEDDVYYDSIPIENSYLSSDPEKREKLTAIIQNAYPFLTLDDVIADMKTAGYTLTSGCGIAEFVTATQWAIWEVANDATIYEVTGEHGWSISNELSPITSYRSYRNYSTNIKSDIEKIRQYLLSREADIREELKITNQEVTSVTENNGEYSVTIRITLNRALEEDETAEVILTDSNGNTTTVQAPNGVTSFDVTLDDVQKNAGIISIDLNAEINGGYLGVVYYDSNQYQDMIGGKLINTYSDSAIVKLGDKTAITVKKQWDGSTGAEAVEVTLYANGEKYNGPVTLNSSNDWSYTWENLPKASLEGEEIIYTVKENLVPGYRSQVISSSTEKSWKQVTAIEDGGTYMFVSSSGALASQNNSSGYIKWLSADTSEVTDDQQAAMWNVDIDTSGSQDMKIVNSLSGNKLVLVKSGNSYRYYERSADSTSYVGSIGISGGKISSHYNGSTYYLSSVSSSGYASSTTTKSSGASFVIYKLIDEFETTFTVINTEVDEVTSISAEKVWKDEKGNALDETPESIEVSLLADGEQYGNPIILNNDNNWKYQWTGLPKNDSDGKELKYTLKEVAVEGFESEITESIKESEVKQNVWTQATQLEDGKTYIFANNGQALSKTNADNEYLEMSSVDVSDAENTSELSMWKATASGSGFNLTNVGKTDRTLALYSRTQWWTTRRFVAANSSSSYINTRELSYSNNYLTASNYRFDTISSGYGSASTNSGITFTLYVLSDETVTTTQTHYTITNTKISETTDLKIHKVDYNDTEKVLKGAVFDVYRETGTETDGLIPMTSDKYGSKVFEGVTTDETGELVLEGLSKKVSYYLIEITAPDGYNKLNKPIDFIITESGISVSDTEMSVNVSTDSERILLVKNEVGYTLPETGSYGTHLFTLGGSLMILSALFLLYKKRSKERCESL